MLESKNENNLSYVQSLNYINNHKEDKTIITISNEKMKLEKFKKNTKKRNTLLTLGLSLIILGGGYNII